MRQKSSFKFEIPVPWAKTPACVEAEGPHAIVIAGSVLRVVTIAVTLYLVLTAG